MNCRKPHVASSICLRATIFQNSEGPLWINCISSVTVSWWLINYTASDYHSNELLSVNAICKLIESCINFESNSGASTASYLIFYEFKSGWLHEKRGVATWNLETNLLFVSVMGLPVAEPLCTCRLLAVRDV
jgi:hypothetical protein